MSETNLGGPQVTGKMYLFKKPELLSPEKHGHLGVAPLAEPFKFCATAKAIPLTISEIPAAAKHYPVVFASPEQPTPLAIVSVVDEVNLFVDDKGNWERRTYVPAYVRRYPFGVAKEENSDRFAIVVDSEFEGLTADAEVRLFDDKEASEFTKKAIDFSKGYEDDRALTSQMVEVLKKHEILAVQTAQYTPANGGDPVGFAQYVGVDEPKLKALSDEAFLELRKSGLLPILFIQLSSLSNWRSLIGRRAERFQLTEDQFLTPVTLAS
ncbi:MAG: SapC family protein [Pseudomonadota bacterium]